MSKKTTSVENRYYCKSTFCFEKIGKKIASFLFDYVHETY